MPHTYILYTFLFSCSSSPFFLSSLPSASSKHTPYSSPISKPLYMNSLFLEHSLSSLLFLWLLLLILGGLNLFITLIEDNSLTATLVRCPFHVRPEHPVLLSHSIIMLDSSCLFISVFLAIPQLVGRYHSFCSPMLPSGWLIVNSQKLLSKRITFNNMCYLYFSWNPQSTWHFSINIHPKIKYKRGCKTLQHVSWSL